MADTRIPNDYLESIINSRSIPPMIRVLHWYYRNMFGWNKNFKKGYFKIKSFSNTAESLNISKNALNRILNNLVESGFFSVDFKEKTFFRSQQIVIKCDNKSDLKLLPKEEQKNKEKVIKCGNKSYQKRQLKVINNDNRSYQKRQLLPEQSLENTGVDKTLKHSLKQDLKTLSKSKEEKKPVFDDNFDIRNLQRHCDKFDTSFSKIDWKVLRDMLENAEVEYPTVYVVLSDLIKKYKGKEDEIVNVSGLFYSVLRDRIKILEKR